MTLLTSKPRAKAIAKWESNMPSIDALLMHPQDIVAQLNGRDHESAENHVNPVSLDEIRMLMSVTMNSMTRRIAVKDWVSIGSFRSTNNL